jgi:PKD repeat protein
MSENAASLFWDFGDGANSTDQNPLHTYSDVGNFTVNLTANNVNGTDSKFATINVFEKSTPVLPVANFSSNVTEGYAPLFVQFTDLSENATGINWDFGDGTNSIEKNPLHTYSTAGNYSVNLTASNENGTASMSIVITVLKQPTVLPVANFSSDAVTGSAPLSVQFTDLSKGATAWNWDFGDGALSTEQNPSHTYNVSGNYTVTLTVSNEAGIDNETKTSYIKVISVPSKLTAAFAASPSSGNAPLKVAFTDKSTGSPTSWKWSFGDGTYSTARNPVHTYTKTGKYTITLTVKNAKDSNTVTKKNLINVKNYLKPPVATFSASPVFGNAPLKVVFTDKSKGSPTSWKWSFGDGTHSTDRNPVHTYSKYGKYTVSLTVKNSAGKSTLTGFNYIKVSAPLKPPVAAFSAYPTSGKKPLKVTFIDKSSGAPTSWKWSFGDGTYSTTRNPTHIYTKTGKYTVTLTVKNAKDSSTKKIYGYITVSKK